MDKERNKMTHVGQVETVTARKSHHCSWCGDEIAKGEKYESTFVAFEGNAWQRKMHQECATAERAYDYGGDILYYEGQFQRGHNHERYSDTTEISAKHGCPACIAELTKKEIK